MSRQRDVGENRSPRAFFAAGFFAAAGAAGWMVLMGAGGGAGGGALAAEAAGPGEYLSPVALVASPDQRTLYVAEATAKQVAVLVPPGKVTKEIPLADPPAGLVLAPDGGRLYVAGASPVGKVHVIDTQALKVIESLSVGHTPTALAISPDGKRLYVCNRFDNTVSILDLSTKKDVATVAVTREPIAAAITPDGKTLVVANHLPLAPASGNYVAAVVSVIAADTGQVAAAVQLSDGSTGLRGICVSPDGRFAYVTHILAHYQIPTTQLERGWMNTNAVSIIDLGTKKLVNTVLLDSVDLGAANPWGVACTADGKFLCIAHAGTHEVSVIGLEALHDRLAKAAAGQKATEVSSSPADVPSDLAFLVGLRARVKLQGKGPRGLAVVGNRVYTAEYFSDSLGVVDIQAGAQIESRSIPLGPVRPMTPVRKGELFFNDAALCFQMWQSCASCHPDARADALNWDLLNDGLGNPKNTKSMLLAHRTPPAMISGIRPSAEVAVRAGIRFIQFAIRPEEDAVAIDEYLKSLTPVPSPHLENGKRSAAAERGEQVFESAGCAACHPGDLGTDLKKHDVGIGPDQRGTKEFDTPTLVEVWRTAPYLFDGRAVAILEMLTKFNPKDTHGATSKLSKQQIDDLAEYILSR